MSSYPPLCSYFICLIYVSYLLRYPRHGLGWQQLYPCNKNQVGVLRMKGKMFNCCIQTIANPHQKSCELPGDRNYLLKKKHFVINFLSILLHLDIFGFNHSYSFFLEQTCYVMKKYTITQHFYFLYIVFYYLKVILRECFISFGVITS